ncbi:hypothetical protein VTL71DRAFT_8123 [Oculimacula yallundae]|uniref:BTB domain-containing protein n=1 Tax=Oculimacula yallundae TaxID=86028 RepID=A0ABR4CWT4_9HELO
MASPPVIPKKPTAVEFLKLMSGPKVDVIVGEKKKLYRLPKDLLSHYSPYFDRCFGGEFKEAKEKKLELFGGPDQSNSKKAVKLSMAMIAYADRFDMGEFFCQLLYDNVRDAMSNIQRGYDCTHISPKDVEQIYRITRKGNPFRTLVAQGVLSCGGLPGDHIAAQFWYLEEEIPDFAIEMLKQIRLSMPWSGKWIDPFSGTQQTARRLKRMVLLIDLGYIEGCEVEDARFMQSLYLSQRSAKRRKYRPQ